jgi:DNA-binding transcriptional LysR family regulator
MESNYLATVPFDLADLHVFLELAATGHFTQAAQRCGLTQSALTRRIQAMEAKLGVALFLRTTRRVTLTEAGRYLATESRRLVGDVSTLLTEFSVAFGGARPSVRVGVSRSLCLSHLPGLFGQTARGAALTTHVVHETSRELIEAVDEQRLDVAILCPPARLPAAVEITHRFADSFCLRRQHREPTGPTGSGSSAG